MRKCAFSMCAFRLCVCVCLCVCAVQAPLAGVPPSVAAEEEGVCAEVPLRVWEELVMERRQQWLQQHKLWE